MSGLFAYVCLGTRDLPRACRFYDATMAALGFSRCVTSGEPGSSWDGWAGWGIYEDEGRRQDALWVCKPFNGKPASPGNGVMAAFIARSWTEVDTFHAAALANGGVCEGPPGLRKHYSPDFYAAYVRDPDGNKLAAVCRGFTKP